MTPEQIQQHVAGIGQRFVEVAPADWYHLVGNWEASPDPSGVSLNFLTLAVVDLGDRWGFGQIEFDEPLYDAVAEFALAARSRPFSGSGPWTVLDLEINNEGQFDSKFGFDEPKRTNGVMDEESIGRFENYLETWIAEHGPVPPR